MREPWARQDDCLASLTTGIVEEEVHSTQKGRHSDMLDIVTATSLEHHQLRLGLLTFKYSLLNFECINTE